MRIFKFIFVFALLGGLRAYAETATLTPSPVSSGFAAGNLTMTVSPTPTPGPAFLYAADGPVVKPMIVHQGGSACLYLDKKVKDSQWKVFDSTGKALATLQFASQDACWSTDNVAMGPYQIQIELEYPDGSQKEIWQKVIVLRKGGPDATPH